MHLSFAGCYARSMGNVWGCRYGLAPNDRGNVDGTLLLGHTYGPLQKCFHKFQEELIDNFSPQMLWNDKSHHESRSQSGVVLGGSFRREQLSKLPVHLDLSFLLANGQLHNTHISTPLARHRDLTEVPELRLSPFTLLSALAPPSQCSAPLRSSGIFRQQQLVHTPELSPLPL